MILTLIHRQYIISSFLSHKSRSQSLVSVYLLHVSYNHWGWSLLNVFGFNSYLFYHMHNKTKIEKKYMFKSYLLELYIKTIMFLFCNYIHVFNSSQNDWPFWYKSVISSVEVYDKHIITCHFSYHTLISPHSYIIPGAYWLSGWYHDLGLIKGMIWKMPCNNLYISDVPAKTKIFIVQQPLF